METTQKNNRKQTLRKQSTQSSLSLTSSTQLADAWRETFLDLKAEYETLKQTYCAIQLENNEYEKHITELQQQNDELHIQLLQVKSTVNQEQNRQPMLKLHISSIEDSLKNNDVQIHKLEATTQQYLSTINVLTSDNVAIKRENVIAKQENDRLRIELQRSHQKHDKLQQIHGDFIAANHRQMTLLQDQLQSLQDEIYALKNKERFEFPKVALPPDILPDDMPIIGDYRSLTALPFQLSSLQEHSPTVSRSFIFHPSYFNDNEFSHEDSEELHQNLLRLENENTELIKKLNALEIHEEDGNSACTGDTYEDKEDVLTEFNDDDLDELEELFNKCNDEKRKENEKKTSQQQWTLWCQFFR